MSWGALSAATKIKAAVSLLVIFSGTTFFAWVATSSTNPPILDGKGCLPQKPVPAHVLVLADNTDPFSQKQIDVFKTVLKTIQDNVQPWEMVSIATIRDLPARVVFSACSPENVKDASSVSLLHRPNVNWLELKAKFQREFQEPLQRQLAQMPLNTEAPSSPIIQSMSDAIQQEGRYWSDAQERRILIFSDLMENTKSYTQYSSKWSHIDFENTAKRINYLAQKLDLRDVVVSVYYLTGLPHDRIYMGPEHQKFWMEFFRENGAKDIEFIEDPM